MKQVILISSILVLFVFLISFKQSDYNRCERFFRDTRRDTTTKVGQVHIATFGDGAFLEQTKVFSQNLTKKFPNYIVHRYDMSMIDEEFKEKNKNILSHHRGLGYWLWKPYICKKIYESMNDGDILWYIDGGLILKDNIDFENIVKWCSQSSSGGLACEQDTPQGKFCKKDVFIQLNMEYEKYAPLMQYASGFFMIQRRETNSLFLQEWLDTACIPGMLDDSVSKHPEDNKWTPVVHRHDQAIFSLLAHKYGFDVVPATNESEWPFYRKRPSGYIWQKFWSGLFGT